MSNAQPVPPQNLDAEESVLGAMMLSPQAIDAVIDEVSSSDFYRETHGLIFVAACELHSSGQPVDAITLSDYLETKPHPRTSNALLAVGDRARIFEIAALVPATANVRHYARIVREMSVLRSLIRAGGEITRSAWDRAGTTEELVEGAEALIFKLAQQRHRADLVPVADALRDVFARMQERAEAGHDVVGLASGFLDLDRLTSGWQPGNLVVAAGRPSMGKTALGLGCAAYAAIHEKVPVAIFTLEMSIDEVTQRFLSMDAHVPSQFIRNGRLERGSWDRLHASGERISKAPIFIEDSGAPTMMEISAKARRLKARHPGLGLIVVDYLQLMSGDAENRVQEVSKNSRALKVLARELNVPVLCLSQLSRGVESRHDKRPILSDLRESGSIEQDADLVIFLYRDEYYNPEDPEVEGLAELNIAKHRNGPTGTVKMVFVKRFAKFGDLARPGDVGAAR